MEVLSPGLNGHGPDGPSLPSIDPESILQHLSELLGVTLGASSDDLESPGSLLSPENRSDTSQRCLRFASETQVAIYIQKDLIAPHTKEGEHAEQGR